MSAGTSVPEEAARLVERAQKVALCLDFDGTLSPIVEDPQAARPLPGIVELLGPLAGAVRRRRSRLGPSGRIPG